MRDRGDPPQRLSATSFRHSYWTVSQLVAHHTVNGCNLRPGDLFGTGTQSGPTPAEAGSLVELSKGGSSPLAIGKDEQRTFLEDGDSVIFRGWCERPGARRSDSARFRAGCCRRAADITIGVFPTRKISPCCDNPISRSIDGWPHARIRYDFAYAWLLRGTAARAAARIFRPVGANRARSRFRQSGPIMEDQRAERSSP